LDPLPHLLQAVINQASGLHPLSVEAVGKKQEKPQ
jgi:hypothetical protein